jgi:hypothetical protein
VDRKQKKGLGPARRDVLKQHPRRGQRSECREEGLLHEVERRYRRSPHGERIGQEKPHRSGRRDGIDDPRRFEHGECDPPTEVRGTTEREDLEMKKTPKQGSEEAGEQCR